MPPLCQRHLSGKERIAAKGSWIDVVDNNSSPFVPHETARLGVVRFVCNSHGNNGVIRYSIGMGNFIKLQPDGFHSYTYNPDRRVAHIIRRNKDGTFSILNKNSRVELNLEFFTEDEAENWFYDDDGVVKFIIPKLRNSVHIDPAVTMEDIVRIVKRDEHLDNLADELFPQLDFWCQIMKTGGDDGDGETIHLKKRGDVINGQLLISTSPIKVSLNSHVEISENMFLYCNGTRHMGKYDLSILDLLFALFGRPPETMPKYVLTKNGIVDENGLKIYFIEALPHFCDIEEGTTMLDIFRLVDEELLTKMFFEFYSWCHDITAFHTAAEDIQKSDTEFNYSEIYAAMDVEIRSNEKEKKPFDFNIWHDFHVNGNITAKEREANPDWYEGQTTQNYGVMMTPIGAYAWLPLKLEKKVIIEELRTDLNKQVSVVECTRDMTLLEILDAIYWEISFVGGPEETLKFADDMRKQVDEIKAGTIETRPFEELVDKVQKREEVTRPREDEDGNPRRYERVEDLMKEWEEQDKIDRPTEDEV